MNVLTFWMPPPWQTKHQVKFSWQKSKNWVSYDRTAEAPVAWLAQLLVLRTCVANVARRTSTCAWRVRVPLDSPSRANKPPLPKPRPHGEERFPARCRQLMPDFPRRIDRWDFHRIRWWYRCLQDPLEDLVLPTSLSTCTDQIIIVLSTDGKRQLTVRTTRFDERFPTLDISRNEKAPTGVWEFNITEIIVHSGLFLHPQIGRYPMYHKYPRLEIEQNSTFYDENHDLKRTTS